MAKRQLKRQLNLLQVVMLGTAGTIAAEIFVLTGHAAGIAGPMAVAALLIGGVLSYSVALNYCELATTYPETGGAMTYVREGFGNNLLSFLVGSMDCISSTFYAALSATGFAYSLEIFIPGLPIVWVAIAAIVLFSLLNILGVSMVGNAQVILGGTLLIVFVIFIISGFTRDGGFTVETFIASNAYFDVHEPFAIFARMMMTIALTYSAYVGFEVIADDAEEVSQPTRNIPKAILISLTIVTLIYTLVSLVVIGTVPINQLAGSETALTDAVSRFWPGIGVVVMGIAGIIATLTSINSAMLSATREAFTLSRDGSWPRLFSRLSPWRTPILSILFIGGVSALIAGIGVVDFLSFISSAGYLFVLFWSSLAMIVLHKKYPNLERPFKAPFFPLTAYLAAASCFLIVAFTQVRALVFLAVVLGLFSIFYFGFQFYKKRRILKSESQEKRTSRILIPVANPKTAESLVWLSSIIAESSHDADLYVFTGISKPLDDLTLTMREKLIRNNYYSQPLLNHIAHFAIEKNVALHAKSAVTRNLSRSILNEIEGKEKTTLIMMGWPGELGEGELAQNVVNDVLISAQTNVAVLKDKGICSIRNILVPMGGGTHSKLALQIAFEIAESERARVNVYRTYPSNLSIEDIQDQMAQLEEIIVDELGSFPNNVSANVEAAPSVLEGILTETTHHTYDLIVVGASEEWTSRKNLFGEIDDQIALRSPCSVLMVRRYEPVMMNWLRRQVKRVVENNGNG